MYVFKSFFQYWGKQLLFTVVLIEPSLASHMLATILPLNYPIGHENILIRRNSIYQLHVLSESNNKTKAHFIFAAEHLCQLISRVRVWGLLSSWKSSRFVYKWLHWLRKEMLYIVSSASLCTLLLLGLCHSYSVLSPCTVHEISEVLNLLEWMVIGVYF